ELGDRRTTLRDRLARPSAGLRSPRRKARGAAVTVSTPERLPPSFCSSGCGCHRSRGAEEDRPLASSAGCRRPAILGLSTAAAPVSCVLTTAAAGCFFRSKILIGGGQCSGPLQLLGRKPAPRPISERELR